MNLRTTLVLLVLLAGGAGAWYFLEEWRPREAATCPSIKFLDNELTPEALTGIEIKRKGRPPLVLEKVGDEWRLPGKWPVPTAEVDELVRVLTSMHSRFYPLTAGDASKFGLGDDALTLKLTVAGKDVAMKIGEDGSDPNRFTRPTYLQIEGQDDIVRLGPGIVAALDRPIDYFQQRRLFATERAPKDDEGTEKIDQIVADKIEIKSAKEKVTLVKHKDGWKIDDPVKDNVDPDKLKALLAGLLDVWADRFVAKKGKSLEEMGLQVPNYELRVTRPGGNATTVLVGNVSETKERTILKPPPPQPPSPFMPPPKPTIQIVKEEYRYAKLPDNDQVFEIKTDKLKDLGVPLEELRDARLARFKVDDVRKVELDWKGKSLVVAKDGDKWKIEKPAAVDAERQPVADLLDKLADLEARGDDVRYKADPKAVGLDAPIGKIVLTLEEGKKDKTTRTLIYSIGEPAKGEPAKAAKGEAAKEKGKLFVRINDSPRVNTVGDDLVKLAERDAVAYRRRQVVDVLAKEVTKIQIVRGGETFSFARKDGVWSQTAPSPAKLDQAKVGKLLDQLVKLETPEFVADAPKADDLDTRYGLGKPAVAVTLEFEDEKKPRLTLLVGKTRIAKDDSFARLDDGPIFALKKDVGDLLDRDAFAYRPALAWQVKADDIASIRVKKGDDVYTLSKEDERWKIAGPFDAAARPEYANAIAEELSLIRSDKIAAPSVKDLAKFGLDQPYVQFDVVTKVPDKDKSKDVTSTLQIGKLDGSSRYARVGDGDVVFLIGDKALAVIDRGPLDLLDRSLVKLSPGSISQIRYQGSSPFVLDKSKDGWDVIDSPGPKFKADDDAVQATLKPWANLMAGSIAAHGPKVDWAKYGLEKPEAKVVVSLQDKDKKAVEHVLALGKDAGDGKRYARLDQQQTVAVLERDTIEEVAPSYLDFLDPRVLKFVPDAVTTVDRTMKDGDLELVKRDDSWQFVKPAKHPADSLTCDDVIEKTFQLKVRRTAAYPAKDLAKFGLESPVATVTIHLGDDKKHVIKVGDKTGSKTNPDERYAQVDAVDRVVVLPEILSKHLTAPVLYFADRNLASFGAADRLEFVRGDRKAVFVKKGPSWEMIEPVKADADPGLGDFVQSLFRLRADEIVAGKDADKKPFGLEPPVAQWKVFAGDREMLDVQIGDREKGDVKLPRRFARLAKGEQVFLLSPKQSVLALAEYRDRKPWPSLDAAQIDRVVVTGEPVNFKLDKQDGKWIEPDHPDGKIDAKSVTDLLDALASLKVERYIADEKGNLQLYGLEKPAWKFDIKTPTGARTLLLGRTEGDSRRRYAAVAGSDAVFVIGEADASRLTRPLAAYLQTK